MPLAYTISKRGHSLCMILERFVRTLIFDTLAMFLSDHTDYHIWKQTSVVKCFIRIILQKIFILLVYARCILGMSNFIVSNIHRFLCHALMTHIAEFSEKPSSQITENIRGQRSNLLFGKKSDRKFGTCLPMDVTKELLKKFFPAFFKKRFVFLHVQALARSLAFQSFMPSKILI